MRIKAAVCREKNGPLTLEEIDLDSPRPDEVLVKVKSCGICHTDLCMQDQSIPVPLPAVLGHEGCGVVEQVGAEVKGFEPGDPVLMCFDSCGNRVWQIKGKTGRRTITINEAAFRAFEEGLNTRQNIIAFPKKAVDEATADLIARETGLCISDVYYVHLGCIDLERGIITYTRRNSSKPKTYPITKAIWGIVKECVDKRSSELVFPSKEGTLILPGATATFKRAAVECGLNHKKVAPLDKVVFHTLRHTYCSWEAQKGTPLFKIARLVGHKTTAMTERYSHLCPETESQQLIRQDNAAEQLSAILTSLAGKTSESVPQAVLDWVASLESKAPGAS